MADERGAGARVRVAGNRRCSTRVGWLVARQRMMFRPSRHRALASGLVAVILLAVAGCSSDDASSSAGTTATTPQGSPSSAATAGSIPAGDAPIEPGTYRIPESAWSVTDFTVTFPEDWTVQYGHVYASNRDQDDEFGFYAVDVDAIWADACKGGDSGALTEVGPSVDDLAAALGEQPGPRVSHPIETSLGGHPAVRLDFTVPEGFDLAPCNLGDIGLQIWYSPPADKHFVLLADGIASVYILDVNGERQVFLAQHGSTISDQDLAELQAVLDSIRIET